MPTPPAALRLLLNMLRPCAGWKIATAAARSPGFDGRRAPF
jgi:hypothetical protein